MYYGTATAVSRNGMTGVQIDYQIRQTVEKGDDVVVDSGTIVLQPMRTDAAADETPETPYTAQDRVDYFRRQLTDIFQSAIKRLESVETDFPEIQKSVLGFRWPE
jgi:hypothetical protein